MEVVVVAVEVVVVAVAVRVQVKLDRGGSTHILNGKKVPSRADVGKHAWDQWQKVPEVKDPEGYTLTQANIEYVRKLRRDFMQHMLNSNPLIVAGLSLGSMSALVAILGIRKYWPEIKPSFMRAKANLPKNGGRKSVSKKSKKRKSHRK